MKTLDDISTTGPARILIFGKPGSGKTSLASTFPAPVFADVDNNLHVLKSRSYREIFGEPSIIGFETFGDEVDPRIGTIKKARAHMDLIDFLNKVDKLPEVETIVLDSLTAVQDNAMNLVIEMTGAMNRSKTKHRLTKYKVLIPTQADYGGEMAAFEQLMRQLLTSEKNIIAIAHERTEESQSGAVLKVQPLLIGERIRATVGRWFQEVWCLEEARGKASGRILRTESTNQIPGLKSSAYSLPDGIENPTYEKIMEAANAS